MGCGSGEPEPVGCSLWCRISLALPGATLRRTSNKETAAAAEAISAAANRFKDDVDKQASLSKTLKDAGKNDIELLIKQANVVKDHVTDGKPATADARQLTQLAARVQAFVDARPGLHGELGASAHIAWDRSHGLRSCHSNQQELAQLVSCHTRMFERHFVAYGVRIGLRVDCRALLDTLEQDPVRMPCRSAGARLKTTSLMLPCPSGTSFLLVPRVERGRHTVCMPERILLAEVRTLTDVARALAAHAESFVAERAPDHLFVHAGVVGWEGRAIVMPGASFAGKTTLVQAWLEAGATYYSDEFAVLDRTGRVHPFARPLAIRDGSTALTRRVPVAALGAETGTTPLPIGLVLVTSYRAGARWRPRRLTAAPTLLALMRHTVAARGNPEHSMPILKQAVSGGMAFAGLRGEARPLVSAVLRHVRTPMPSALPRQGAI